MSRTTCVALLQSISHLHVTFLLSVVKLGAFKMHADMSETLVVFYVGGLHGKVLWVTPTISAM